ncbi:MAG: patatin-like phospholipase family protein [Myxococcota bacterium]
MTEYANNTGLTLAGGGARGAYTAGVLRYLYTVLPDKLGRIPWAKVVGGTSVGALNGYFAACHDMAEIRRMTEIWTQLKVEQIYTLPVDGIFSAVRRLIQATKQPNLLDASPLKSLIRQEASRRSLRKSILQGRCKAFVIAATRLSSGQNICFVDTADPEFTIPAPPMGEVEYTKLYPEHLLASAAIPLVFPPVQVGAHLYVDGGLRQNTPIHPVLYGGVDRILIVSTRTPKPITPASNLEPSLGLIAGKALNALSLDPVERDARAAERINRILQWGVDRYGPDFASAIERDLGHKGVNLIHIRPSLDLGQLAVECCQIDKLQLSSGTHWFLQRLYEQGQASGESDLLSHLLFDRHYTQVAEDLGFQDAKAQEDRLLAFFHPQSHPFSP